MASFANVARNQCKVGSDIMTERTKIKTDDLITCYPDGVTVIGFDMISGRKGPYPVFAFAENENAFFAGGAALYKVADAWAGMYDGDISAASAALKESGGVKIKLEKIKTKNGNDFVSVEVLD